MQNYEQASAYVATLTGDLNTVMDFRCIHDSEKGVKGIALRGTLNEQYNSLTHYNNQGYGIFCSINETDGLGRELSNIQALRTHVVDMDNTLSSQANYEKAINSTQPPHFAVQTSPNKFHVYWLVERYSGNDFYSSIQRKLRQLYDGDKSVTDASRVLRVPGFFHMKDPSKPHLVSCWSVSGRPRYNFSEIEKQLENVNVFEHIGVRSELGDEELKAPSFDWLKFAISLTNPNDMTRDEWMSISAAFKQSGWSLVSEDDLLSHWLQWCSTYSEDDVDENMKLWDSIRNTEVGWPTFMRRTSVSAYINLDSHNAPKPKPVVNIPTPEDVLVEHEEEDQFGELLDGYECAEYFKNNFFVETEGKVYSSSSRYLNSSQFNGRYGGKLFLITQKGKVSDDPWKAALRSTIWTIPKVDHVRFLPNKKPLEIIKDELRRKGLNTYKPANVKLVEGDPSKFLKHVELIIPDSNDRKVLLDYMAYCIKFPGQKIPWAPMIQGVQGLGKSIFYKVMTNALGEMYTFMPQAKELANSGSKFNGWMRERLMIIVDEIKVDERRELVEILKPMISEARIEIESKGVDQKMEDNYANWLFFSNHKDAIPIDQNDRRYAIFFSVMQAKGDLIRFGMNQQYFDDLFNWLENQDGYAIVNHYFKNYPIEIGELPGRAPETTSYVEALQVSRSPMEIIVEEAVFDELPGFKGGYVSSIALKTKCRDAGMRSPSTTSIKTCLEKMGYIELGRADRSYMQESVTSRATLYVNRSDCTVEGYGLAQGY